MLTFFTDKGKNFECEILIEGASIDNTKARIIFEVSNRKFIFDGKIDSNGKCVFDIPALKEYNIKGNGNCKMEVISEATIFEPFNDEIEIKESKKVEVKLIESKDNINSKIKVNIKNIEKEVPIKEVIKETKKISEEDKKKLHIIEKLSEKINQLKESEIKGYKPSKNIIEFSKQFENIINKKDILKYQYIFENLMNKNNNSKSKLLEI